MKTYIRLLIMLLWLSIGVCYADVPQVITLEGTFSNRATGFIQGEKTVRISLNSGVDIEKDDYGLKVWEEIYLKYPFDNGFLSIELGHITYLNPEFLNVPTPSFVIDISGVSGKLNIPITAHYRAASAIYASRVGEINADSFYGSFPSDTLKGSYEGITALGELNKLFVDSNVVVGDHLLSLDKQSQKIGIATANAQAKLDVNGDMGLQSGYVLFSDGSSLTTTITDAMREPLVTTGNLHFSADSDRNSQGSISVSTGLKTRLFISNYGHVGVNKVDSDARLGINGLLKISEHVGDPEIGLIHYNGFFDAYTEDGWKRLDYVANVAEGWRYDPIERVISFDNQGAKVGVGVTDPQSLLDVKGTIKATVFRGRLKGDGYHLTSIDSSQFLEPLPIHKGGTGRTSFSTGTLIVGNNQLELFDSTVMGPGDVFIGSDVNLPVPTAISSGSGIKIDGFSGLLAIKQGVYVDPLVFYTDGPEITSTEVPIVIDAHTGIGVTMPVQLLDIDGGIHVSMNQNTAVDGLIRYSKGSLEGYVDGGWHKFFALGESVGWIYDDNQPDKILLAADSVGIGVTEPKALLDIKGDSETVGLVLPSKPLMSEPLDGAIEVFDNNLYLTMGDTRDHVIYSETEQTLRSKRFIDNIISDSKISGDWVVTESFTIISTESRFDIQADQWRIVDGRATVASVKLDQVNLLASGLQTEIPYDISADSLTMTSLSGNIEISIPEDGRLTISNDLFTINGIGESGIGTSPESGVALSVAGRIRVKAIDAAHNYPKYPGGPAYGDLTDEYPGPIVSQIQGRLVDNSAPTLNQALVWTGNSWGSGPVLPTGSAQGDLTGGYPNPIVSGLQGRALSESVPNDKDVLMWKSDWIPDEMSGLTPIGSAGGDLSGAYPDPGVVKLQGYAISDNQPETNELLKWDGDTWVPDTDNDSILGVSSGGGLVNTSQVLSLMSGTQNGQQLSWDPTQNVWVLSSPLSVESNGALQLSDRQLSLVPTGIQAGVYGVSSQMTIVSIDSKGYITQIQTESIEDVPPGGPAGGDLSGSYPNPQLAPTGVASGSYGNQTSVGRLTVDSKGRITHIEDVTISGVTPAGSAGGDLLGSYPNPTLKSNGVSVGTYGSQTRAPVMTVTKKGLVESISDVLIKDIEPKGPAGGDLEGTYPAIELKTQDLITGGYGKGNQMPVITVDAMGRITSINETLITLVPPGGPVGGDFTGTFPNPELKEINNSAGIYGSSTKVPRYYLNKKGLMLQIDAMDIEGVEPGGSAGGDLGGTYPSPNVLKIQGVEVSSITPTPNHGLQLTETGIWQSGDLSGFTPGGSAGGDLIGYYPSPGLSFVNNDLDVAGSETEVAQLTVDTKGRIIQIQPLIISDVPPTGNAGGSLMGTYPDPTLVDIGVSTANVGTENQVAKISVNQKGLVTFVQSVSVPGATPAGQASGDLGGSYPDPSVTQLNGKLVLGTTPINGNALIFIDSTEGGMWLGRSPHGFEPGTSAGGDLTGDYPSPQLKTSGVVSGTYGTATRVSLLTVNSKGFVTSANEMDMGAVIPDGPAEGVLIGNYPDPILMDSGVQTGLFGSYNKTARITVNQKGLLTNVEEVPISGVTPAGPAGGVLTGTYPDPTLINSGVTAGTYGSNSYSSRFTVDSKGIVTQADEVLIKGVVPGGPAGGVLSGTYPEPILADNGFIAGEYGIESTVYIPSVAGLVLWLDATNIDGSNNTTLSEGASIATWSDLSGSGYHLSQGTSGNQPVYSSSGIQFDGSDDFLEVSSGSQLTFPETQKVSYFVVFSADSEKNQVVFSKFNAGVSGEYNVTLKADLTISIQRNVTPWSLNSSLTYSANQAMLHSTIYDGSTLTQHVDGTVDSNTDTFGSLSGDSETNFMVGAWLNNSSPDRFFDGYIKEILIFDRQLSGTDLYRIHDYLSEKWALTATVDSDGDGTVDASDSDADGNSVADDDEIKSNQSVVLTVLDTGLLSTVNVTWIESVLPGGPATGDLGGQYPHPLVKQLQGNQVSSDIPAYEDSLLWLDTDSDGVYMWKPEYLTGVIPGGPVGGDLTGAYPDPELPLSGVVSGNYGLPTHVSRLTVSKKGYITSAEDVLIEGVPPSGPIVGDFTGNFPDPVAVKIQGRLVAGTQPTDQQVLKWDGYQWGIGNDLDIDHFAVTNGGLSITDRALKLDQMNAQNGQLLKWDSSGGHWKPTSLIVVAPNRLGIGSDVLTDSTLTIDHSNRGKDRFSGLSVQASHSSMAGITAGLNLFVDGDGTLQFEAWEESVTTALTLNPDGGYIGVATTTPQSPLHIKSNSGGVIPVLMRLQGSGKDLGKGSKIRFTNQRSGGVFPSSDEYLLGHIEAVQLTDTGTSGSLVFSTSDGLTSGGSESLPRFVIRESGLLGIGTTEPLASIHVSGSDNDRVDLSISGTQDGSAELFIGTTAEGVGLAYQSATGYDLGVSENRITFYSKRVNTINPSFSFTDSNSLLRLHYIPESSTYSKVLVIDTNNNIYERGYESGTQLGLTSDTAADALHVHTTIEAVDQVTNNGTIFYTGTSPTGIPIDQPEFRMVYDNNYFGTYADALIISTAVRANQSRNPIKLLNQGTGSLSSEEGLTIDTYGHVGLGKLGALDDVLFVSGNVLGTEGNGYTSTLLDIETSSRPIQLVHNDTGKSLYLSSDKLELMADDNTVLNTLYMTGNRVGFNRSDSLYHGAVSGNVTLGDSSGTVVLGDSLNTIFDYKDNSGVSVGVSPPLLVRKDSSGLTLDTSDINSLFYNNAGLQHSWTKLSLGSRLSSNSTHSVGLAGIASDHVSPNINADQVNGELVLWTNKAGSQQERVRLTHTGKIGINNSSPSYDLDVKGLIQLTGAIHLSHGKSLISREPDDSQSSQWQPKLVNPTNDTRQDAVDLYVAGDVETASPQQVNPVLSILENGYVGIGVTNPLKQSHIVSYGEEDAIMRVSAYSTNEDATLLMSSIQSYGAEDYLRLQYKGASDILSLGFRRESIDYDQPYLTISSEGRVGILNESPQYALDVAGNLDSNGDVYVDGALHIAASEFILGLGSQDTASSGASRVFTKAGNTLGVNYYKDFSDGIEVQGPVLKLYGQVKQGDAGFSNRLTLLTANTAEPRSNSLYLYSEGTQTDKHAIISASTLPTGGSPSILMYSTDIWSVQLDNQDSDKLKFDFPSLDNLGNISQLNTRLSFDSSLNMVVGDGSASSSLTVLDTDSGTAELAIAGTSEGTGLLFVGKSVNNGVGLGYDGTGNETLVGDENRMVMFRRNNDIDTEVFSYASNSNLLRLRELTTTSATKRAQWSFDTDGRTSFKIAAVSSDDEIYEIDFPDIIRTQEEVEAFLLNDVATGYIPYDTGTKFGDSPLSYNKTTNLLRINGVSTNTYNTYSTETVSNFFYDSHHDTNGYPMALVVDDTGKIYERLIPKDKYVTDEKTDSYIQNDITSSTVPYKNSIKFVDSPLVYQNSKMAITNLSDLNSSNTFVGVDADGKLYRVPIHTDKVRTESEVESYISNSFTTNYIPYSNSSVLKDSKLKKNGTLVRIESLVSEALTSPLVVDGSYNIYKRASFPTDTWRSESTIREYVANAVTDGTIPYSKVSDFGHASAITHGSDVGIGRSPNTKLDVNGGIKLGTSTQGCSNTTKGAMRYNSTKKTVDYCTGSSWVDLLLLQVTFTNCGASGIGPNYSQVDATYTSGNPLFGLVTVPTLGVQRWTVPTTGTYSVCGTSKSLTSGQYLDVKVSGGSFGSSSVSGGATVSCSAGNVVVELTAR